MEGLRWFLPSRRQREQEAQHVCEQEFDPGQAPASREGEAYQTGEN